MKNIIVAVIAVVVIGLGLVLYMQFGSKDLSANPTPDTNGTQATSTDMATSTDNTNQTAGPIEVIGQSGEGRDITAYHFGSGDKEVLFVGGIHGGYSWNTALLAYELIEYLEGNPNAVPGGVKVTVVPVLNPDGLNKVVDADGPFAGADVSKSQTELVAGRFNANEVDLNRNFDCDWQQTGKWQTRTVSGGTAAFSEPESKAMRDYIATHKPAAAVVWYSSAGGVFASNCHTGVLPETTAIMNVYSKASGYPADESFDFYATTGDMTNWLAKIGVPAISVLLTDHTNIEWSKNQKGIDALLKHIAE